MEPRPKSLDNVVTLSPESRARIHAGVLRDLTAFIGIFEELYDKYPGPEADMTPKRYQTFERWLKNNLEQSIFQRTDFFETQNDLAGYTKTIVELYETLAALVANRPISRKVREQYDLRDGEYAIWVDYGDLPSSESLERELFPGGMTTWTDLALSELRDITGDQAKDQSPQEKIFFIKKLTENIIPDQKTALIEEAGYRAATFKETLSFLRAHPELITEQELHIAGSRKNMDTVQSAIVPCVYLSESENELNPRLSFSWLSSEWQQGESVLLVRDHR